MNIIFSESSFGGQQITEYYDLILNFFLYMFHFSNKKPLTGVNERSQDIADKGDAEKSFLGDALGYDPTEGGQKAYDYGDY